MIEAQDMLKSMQVADYPWAKANDRDKLHREIHKMAYPKIHQEVMTLEEMSERIGAMING